MMTMMNMNMDYEAYKAWEEMCCRMWDKIFTYFKENHTQILAALASATGSSYTPRYVG